MNREDILNEAMTAPDATEIAPGVKLRRIDTMSMSWLSRVNSPFTDLDAAAGGNVKFRLHELIEFVFLHAAPRERIQKVIYGSPTAFSREADEFCSAIPKEKLALAVQLICGDAQAIQAAQAAALPDGNAPASKNARSPAALRDCSSPSGANSI